MVLVYLSWFSWWYIFLSHLFQCRCGLSSRSQLSVCSFCSCAVAVSSRNVSAKNARRRTERKVWKVGLLCMFLSLYFTWWPRQGPVFYWKCWVFFFHYPGLTISRASFHNVCIKQKSSWFLGHFNVNHIHNGVLCSLWNIRYPGNLSNISPLYTR